MKIKKKEKDDYDSPWKEAIGRYFKEFIALFLPQAFVDIDWEAGYEFLDKELQKVARRAKLGKRLVDKLVKVRTKEGKETWVLVHVEVQSRKDPGFEKRMYIYSSLLYNRYDREVVSLAVLADQNPAWKPKSFGYERWGCRVILEFPAVKLVDIEWSVLESSSNPFSIIVMAHLKAQATRQDMEGRLQWKVSLVKTLYKKGFGKNDIIELFLFIDWLMNLPEDLNRIFKETMKQYEEETKMPYVTSVERSGIKIGRQEGRQEGLLEKSREAVIEVLETRFEAVPGSIAEAVKAVGDLAFLKELLKEAVKTPSLKEFEQALGKART